MSNNPGHFKPGVSGNPAGRPRVGETLAEAMRKRFPVETIVELAAKLTMAADERVRMAALQFIADRAHGKVLSTSEVTVTGGTVPARVDWSAVPLERRKMLMDALAEVDAIAEPDRDAPEPGDDPDGD